MYIFDLGTNLWLLVAQGEGITSGTAFSISSSDPTDGLSFSSDFTATDANNKVGFARFFIDTFPEGYCSL